MRLPSCTYCGLNSLKDEVIDDPDFDLYYDEHTGTYTCSYCADAIMDERDRIETERDTTRWLIGNLK